MRNKIFGNKVRRAGVVIFAAVAMCLSLHAAAGQDDVAAAVAGNNDFAFDLYANLKDQPGNLIYSPYSISSALAMTWAGARGNTETQMAQVLHFTLPQEKLHPAMAAITKDLNDRGGAGKYELAVANRLWGQTGMALLDSFLDLNKKFYGAGLETTDFAADPEAARRKINAWCAEKTRDKIMEPVPQGAINSATALVLANAIYFKGMWASQFKKDNTGDAPFYLSAAKQVPVPMMTQKAKYRWGGKDGASFLEMPYVGDDLAMVVVLPDDTTGLPEVEKKLNAEWLDSLLASGSTAEVTVYLPRFKLEWGTEMSQALSGMGMPDAFSGAADFSGMTGSPGLSISKVIHKAMVDVNEEGTEAAAVTVVIMGKSAAVMPTIFRADHPFIFMIRDRKTGSILFIGRVADPRG